MAEQTTSVLQFDGSNDYVEIGTADSLGLTNSSFTVETWLYVNEFSETDQPILGTNIAGKNRNLHLIIRNQKSYLGFYSNDSSGKTLLSKHIWYHLAWRYNQKTGEQALFVNGILDNTSKGHAPLNSKDKVTIGHTAGTRFFNGLLSDLRIWRYSRSINQILANIYKSLKGNEADLAAYWRLDEGEGTQATDSIKHQKNGKIVNAKWVKIDTKLPFQATKLLKFDGVTSYVEMADSDAIDFDWNQNFTIECWIKADTNQADKKNSDNDIIEKWNGSSGYPYVIRYLRSSGKIIGARYDGTNNPRVQSLKSINDNQFHHIAFVKNNSQLELYIDGIKENSTTDTVKGNTRNNSPLYLARRGRVGNFFKGHVAELRIWNHPRSDQQIQAYQKLRLKGNEAGLVAYWSLNKDTKQIAKDSLSFTHNGVLKGNPTWTQAAVPLLQTNETQASLSFNGKTDYITVPHKNHLVLKKALSVEAYIKAPKTTADDWHFPVVSKHGNASGWELRFGSRTVGFLLTINRRYFDISINNIAQNDLWYHVAASYDGNTLKLYINGLLKAQKKIGTNTPITQYLGNLNIARNNRWTDRLYIGEITEVRLWNKVLSAANIQANLFKRLKGTEAGLVGYWPLSDGQGQTITDSSTYKNHGTLVGADWVRSSLVLRTSVTDTLNEKLENLQRENTQLRDKLDLAQTSIQALETVKKTQTFTVLQLEADKKKLIENNKQQLAEKKQEIIKINQDHQLQLDLLAQKEGAETTLANLIQKTNDEIGKARAELITTNSSHRLGKVTMEFKMMPGPGGIGMSFPNREELTQVTTNQLSTLNLDFSPVKTAEIEKSQTKVSNVIGYTEIMAKRKLKEAGFAVEISHQTVTHLNELDRVVNQYPQAETEFDAGKTVMIFIGKQS